MTANRPTIADVAREAGASASTVSVVFSGKAVVSDDMAERVRAAAAKLGYAGPDPRAASLRRGRSGVVAVVFGERLGSAFRDPVKTAMMDGLTEALAPLGAGLLLMRVEPSENDEPETAALPGPTLASAAIDAAVFVSCAPGSEAEIEALVVRGIPVVVVEAPGGPGVPHVILDNRHAQALAATYLTSLGHRDVVTVTLPRDRDRRLGFFSTDEPIPVDVTAERLAGVLDVFPNARAFAAGGSFFDEGFTAGQLILATPGPRPTAILAQSDLLAAGVIRAIEASGLRVPEDISVTGFDGVTVEGLAPHVLTTLVQDAEGKGRAAGLALAAQLAGDPAASIEMTCEFRVGNTTGPALTP